MKWILALGILFVLTLFTVRFFDRQQERNTAGTVRPASTAAPSFAAKSDSGEGGVTVTAQPVVVDTEDIVFEFTVDTHSGDLTNFSVLEKVSLISGDKEVLSKDWQETASSAHHRSGKLVFEKGVRQLAESEVELVVKDLAGVPERRLKWTLLKKESRNSEF